MNDDAHAAAKERDLSKGYRSGLSLHALHGDGKGSIADPSMRKRALIPARTARSHTECSFDTKVEPVTSPDPYIKVGYAECVLSTSTQDCR
jgi:hypothetical protein